MRDRVVFFLLVAIVATVAYFVSDMEKADAQKDLEIFDNVVIKGGLLITGGKLVVENPKRGKVNNRFAVTVVDNHVSITLDNYKGAIRAGEPSSKVAIGVLQDEKWPSSAYMRLTSNSGKSEKLITSLDRK